MFERLLHASALFIGLIIVDGITQAAEAQGSLDRLRGESRSFDECLLQNMRGVTSDEAARAISFACRNKHPTNAPRHPPLTDVTNLSVGLRGELIIQESGHLVPVIYHNTPRLIIMQISFEWGFPNDKIELRCNSNDGAGVSQGRSGRFWCGDMLSKYHSRSADVRSELKVFGYFE
jgi:hypothetical protein